MKPSPFVRIRSRIKKDETKLNEKLFTKNNRNKLIQLAIQIKHLDQNDIIFLKMRKVSHQQ